MVFNRDRNVKEFVEKIVRITIGMEDQMRINVKFMNGRSLSEHPHIM